jgi:hypothetical protein
MSVDIYDAINAFAASETGKGRRGTAVQRRRAIAVLRKLWQLWGEDEIGFHDLERLFGDSHEWRFWTDDIRLGISTTGGDVAAASVTLVHEALHLVEDMSYVDEELACRQLQLLYYPELLPPGTLFSNRRRRRVRAIITVGTGREQSLSDQSRFAARDQLVDYVINIRTYADSLEVDWVARHARDWGGLSNRWGSTKGEFLRVLGGDHDASAEQAGLIVAILESVSPTEWREVIRTAGGEDKVRRAVRFALYSNEYYGRLQSVQSSTGAPTLIGG